MFDRLLFFGFILREQIPGRTDNILSGAGQDEFEGVLHGVISY
jgi:hypothetical protein